MGRKAARTTESRPGMRLTGGSVSYHGGEKDTMESMSDSVREVKSLLASPVSRHTSISPVRPDTVQKPSMEIVPVEEEPSLEIVAVEEKPILEIVAVEEKPILEIVAVEEKADVKECVVFEAGHLQSSGCRKDRDEAKNKRSGSSGTLWGKFLRKLKINSLLGRPNGIPQTPRDPTHSDPGQSRGKRNHWVRDLRNFFVPHSKQHHHDKSSGRSTVQREYLLVQNGKLPPTVPPQDERLRLLWKLTNSEPQHHANISMTGGSGKEIEESIPLLGYPEVLKADAVGGGDSASAIAPPWILRKWKMKDSQKLLRIHPEKEVLFQPTDDADEKYACSIVLQNRTKGFVAFKFKGTCPDVFAMKPKHGLLGPNLTIKVDAFRYGDPFSSSGRKKDLFVIMTLPVPVSLIKNEAVGSFVFRRFEDQCRCEGVLRAIFRSPEKVPEIKSYESEVDEQTRMDDLYRSLTFKRLASIPESEPGR